VKKRLADIDGRLNGEVLNEAPVDVTTWYINSLEKEPVQAEKKAEKIAHRLMVLNFAAIHTSTFAATSVIFDIFSTPPEDGVIPSLREEIRQVLSDNDEQWSKEILAKMVKLDSAVRESLRLSTFLTKGMDRLVVDPNGVTMENGLHLPRGTVVGSTAYSIHHDNHFYENAMKFDAFRFSRAREGSSSVLDGKNQSIVTTSETFLSFGHGRHACPGRFFAASELKLLLAYVIMNYDVKPLPSRPPNANLAGTILPPMKATIEVKRRKATEKV